MNIHRFHAPGLAQFSYVLSSQGQAVVIDPVRDLDTYLDYLSTHSLTLAYVLETHIHADFASGAAELAAGTGAQLALSAYDRGETYTAAMPHLALHDGDTLPVGAVRLQALHTPGHTPEHLSFLAFDSLRSGTTPVTLFSGDFLFVGSVGRPDLLGEDAKLGLAHSLYHSLHHRINSLPDGVAVCPGHGAGSLCGAGLGDMPTSTLGYERATQPLFSLDEPGFVAAILASVPPMPTYYPRMKALNAAGAPMLPVTPGGKPLSIAELQTLQQQGAVLLDLRRPEAFAGAHIPGALNIGADQNLPLWAGWLLSPTTPIVLVADPAPLGTVQLAAARRDLIRVGIDSAVGHLHNGFPTWVAAGLPTASIAQIAPSRMPAGHLILDVRTPSEFSAGHLPHSQNIPLGDLPAALSALHPLDPTLTVCGSGYRSSIAASLLAAHGFTNVASLAGGISACRRLDLTLTAA